MIDSDKINIVLVDGNELFREGMKRILEGSTLFEVIGEGVSIFEILDSLESEPDIIMMDNNLYDRTNFDETKDMLSDYPNTKLVLLTSEKSNHQVLSALEQGVRGYLTNEMNVSSLMEGLKVIHSGKYWIHPDITHNLIVEYMQMMQNSTGIGIENTRINYREPLTLFTAREYQVLQLLASGYNNQQIAQQLGVTQSTVKNHVTSIFVKMKVNDRTQAVIRAIQNNWVEVDKVDFEPLN